MSPKLNGARLNLLSSFYLSGREGRLYTFIIHTFRHAYTSNPTFIKHPLILRIYLFILNNMRIQNNGVFLSFSAYCSPQFPWQRLLRITRPKCENGEQYFKGRGPGLPSIKLFASEIPSTENGLRERRKQNAEVKWLCFHSNCCRLISCGPRVEYIIGPNLI